MTPFYTITERKTGEVVFESATFENHVEMKQCAEEHIQNLIRKPKPKGETMKTKYNKFEYQEAKKIIKDAQILTRYSDPCQTTSTYRTADGEIWREHESKLEPPEDDYTLIRIETKLES